MYKTKEEFKKLCEFQIKAEIAYCYLCGKPIISIKDYNIDHVYPLSRGGKDIPSNWAMAHKKCNEEKGALLLDEFKQYLYLKAKRDGRIK